MAGEAGAIRAGACFVEAWLKDDRLEGGLKAIEKRLKAFAGIVTEIGKRTALVGAAMTAPFLAAAGGISSALASIKAASAGAGAEALQLEQLALKLNGSVAGLQSLAAAARVGGAGLSELGGGLTHMTGFLQSIADGSGDAANKLALIGVQWGELRMASPEEQLERIADGLSRIGNTRLQVNLTQQIFGGTELLPMLRQGAAGIRAMREEAMRMGKITSPADIASLSAMQKAFLVFTDSLKRVGTALASAVAPALAGFFRRASDALFATSRWLDVNRNLVTGIARLGTVLTISGTAIMGLGLALRMGAGPLLGLAGGLGAAVVLLQRSGRSFTDLARSVGISNTAVLSFLASAEAFIGKAARMAGAWSPAAILGTVAAFRLAAVAAPLATAALSGVLLPLRLLRTVAAPVILAIRGIGLALASLRAVSIGGSILGGLVGVVGSLVSLVVPGIALVGSALLGLLSPVGLVVAGVVGLGSWFLYSSGAAGRALDAIKVGLGGLASTASSTFGGLLATAQTAFGGIMAAIRAGDWTSAFRILSAAASVAWEQVKAGALELWPQIKDIAVSAWNAAVEAIITQAHVVWDTIASEWPQLAGILTSAFNLAVEGWRSAVALFAGDWSNVSIAGVGAMTAIGAVVASAVTPALSMAATAAWALIAPFAAAAAPVAAIVAGVAAIGAAVVYCVGGTEALSAAWEGVKAVAVALWDTVTAFLSPAIAGLTSMVSDALGGAWEAVTSIATSLWGVVTDIADLVGIDLLGDWSDVWEVVKSIATTIGSALGNAVRVVAQAVGSVLGAAFRAVGVIITGIVDSVRWIISGFQRMKDAATQQARVTALMQRERITMSEAIDRIEREDEARAAAAGAPGTETSSPLGTAAAAVAPSTVGEGISGLFSTLARAFVPPTITAPAGEEPLSPLAGAADLVGAALGRLGVTTTGAEAGMSGLKKAQDDLQKTLDDAAREREDPFAEILVGLEDWERDILERVSQVDRTATPGIVGTAVHTQGSFGALGGGEFVGGSGPSPAQEQTRRIEQSNDLLRLLLGVNQAQLDALRRGGLLS